jgi:hypothetical protein
MGHVGYNTNADAKQQVLAACPSSQPYVSVIATLYGSQKAQHG